MGPNYLMINVIIYEFGAIELQRTLVTITPMVYLYGICISHGGMNK